MSRHEYEPELTMRDAVTRYFVDNNFGPDGGYSSPWVDLTVGPLRVVIPNTKGRVKAVRFHDLHHVLTEYQTDLAGEGEISAWELTTGCANHPAALVLNLSAFASGMLIAPRKTFAAFRRGLRTGNLYRDEYGPALLAQTVGALRERLGLRRDQELGPVTARDVVMLVGAVVAGAPVSLLMLGGMIVLLPVALVQHLRRRQAEAHAQTRAQAAPAAG